MKETRRTLFLYFSSIISIICILCMIFLINIVMIHTAKTEEKLMNKFEVNCIDEIERSLKLIWKNVIIMFQLILYLIYTTRMMMLKRFWKINFKKRIMMCLLRELSLIVTIYWIHQLKILWWCMFILKRRNE